MKRRKNRKLFRFVTCLEWTSAHNELVLRS